MKAARITTPYTAAALLLCSLSAAAASQHQDVSHIAPGSLNDVSGVIGINMAAGDNNAQANLHSIAIGENAQVAHRNQMTVNASSTDGAASASIEAGTLNNAYGLISVNQAAGSGNIQLNSMAIALGENVQISSVDLLTVRVANNDGAENTEEGLGIKNIYLDKNALNGAAGAIQVSQIAGHGNIAVNRVSMPLN